MAESFGDAVRRLRLANDGISLRRLAKIAAVNPGHLSRIQAGKRPPSAQIAAALDRVLHADGSLIALAAGPTGRTTGLPVEHWGRHDADDLAAALLAETPT